MGLDQYAFARKGDRIETTEDYTYQDFDGNTHTEQRTSISYEEENEIAYWRKHPNLQGWMEQLWRSKGNDGEFNCVDVELTAADLDQLEYDMRFNQLPETQGFFFGNNSDDYYKEADEEFIREARQYLSDGYKIVYTSWW
jgi:hypothetical protein